VRIGFQTFGCRSNHADTIDLQAALVEQGLTPCESDYEVLVVNTCSVTDQADNEAYRFIRKTKKDSPNIKVIVTGCLAELEPQKLAELKEVDSVIGPGRKQEVLKSILSNNLPDQKAPFAPTEYRPERKSISLNEPISNSIAGPGQTLGEVNQRARYHLRIQEGCENACTFCIIPHTRGHLSSRSKELILQDVIKVADTGYSEIVITGTHIGGYGEDCGSSLLELLKAIKDLNAGPRIRLSSIDPNDLSPDLLDFFLENQGFFCPHLHICVQSFCDSILKRMNRRYRLADVEKIVFYITDKVSGICLGTDLITGFPGESRQEVDQAVCEFLRLPFSYLHVFPYSERSGTAATRLDGSVLPAERKRRAARWRSIGERKREDYYSSLLSKTLNIVVEKIEDDFIYGTSAEYVAAKVRIDPETKIPAIGQFAQVHAIAIVSEEKRLLCQLSNQVS
jgi:threonylcarbamoyladenosine tRNA methylthiotransferase MtaB